MNNHFLVSWRIMLFHYLYNRFWNFVWYSYLYVVLFSNRELQNHLRLLLFFSGLMMLLYYQALAKGSTCLWKNTSKIWEKLFNTLRLQLYNLMCLVTCLEQEKSTQKFLKVKWSEHIYQEFVYLMVNIGNWVSSKMFLKLWHILT